VLDHILDRREDLEAATVTLRADHEVRAELGDFGGPDVLTRIMDRVWAPIDF